MEWNTLPLASGKKIALLHHAGFLDTKTIKENFPDRKFYNHDNSRDAIPDLDSDLNTSRIFSFHILFWIFKSQGIASQKRDAIP